VFGTIALADVLGRKLLFYIGPTGMVRCWCCSAWKKWSHRG